MGMPYSFSTFLQRQLPLEASAVALMNVCSCRKRRAEGAGEQDGAEHDPDALHFFVLLAFDTSRDLYRIPSRGLLLLFLLRYGTVLRTLG